MNELQDEYYNDNRISQSVMTIQKTKIKEKQDATEALEMQKKIESEIPIKVNTEKLTDKQKKCGDVSKKVAVKINEKTIIFVDPDNVEAAKERWLERHEEAFRNTFRKGINVNNNR